MSITGAGGFATQNIAGVSLATGAVISVTGGGAPTVTGTGGNSGSSFGFALRLAGTISAACQTTMLRIGDKILFGHG